MAGVQFVLSLQNAEAVAALTRLARAASDLEPFFADVGEYLLQSIEARFRDEVDPDGNQWTELSPDYEARKRGPKILTEDHHLRRMHYQISQDELEVGAEEIYGATHQLGDEERGIPDRPFLGLNDDDEREITAIAMDYFEAAIGG